MCTNIRAALLRMGARAARNETTQLSSTNTRTSKRRDLNGVIIALRLAARVVLRHLLCQQSVLFFVLPHHPFVRNAVLELPNVLLRLLHRGMEIIPQLFAGIDFPHRGVGDDLNFLQAVRAGASRVDRRRHDTDSL
jgi:hypothetical protein